MTLFIKRVSKRLANGRGTDIITLADGMITIRVNKVEGNQVQLAIDCPKDIDIKRGETLHATTYTQKDANE